MGKAAHIPGASSWCQGRRGDLVLQKCLLIWLDGLAVPYKTGSDACSNYGTLSPLSYSNFLRQHLLEDLKAHYLYGHIWSQTFKEIFLRSLADHRDNRTEVSDTSVTTQQGIIHFAKIIWQGHKLKAPALKREKSSRSGGKAGSGVLADLKNWS